MLSTMTDEKEKKRSVLISDESERISRILEFLTYSGISAESAFDKESDIFQILVPDFQYEKASALLNIYLDQEPDEEEEDKSETPLAKVFVGSEEKYKDNSSSAFSFFVVGALVILVLFLASARILPLPLTFREQPMMVLALSLISVLFIAIGIYSLHRAKGYKVQMEEENTLETSILKWFMETYTKDQIDRSIEAEEGEIPKEEVLCLRRFSLIHDYLIREYPSLEDSHADSLSETIYQKLYENDNAKKV